MIKSEIISINLDKKALVLGFSHPFNAVKMMGTSISAALVLNGYEVTAANIGENDLVGKLGLLNDEKLELVFCLGSIPLDLMINSKRLWDYLSEDVIIVELILDSLPYDFRIRGFTEFINSFQVRPNLFIAAFEGNTAKILEKNTGKIVHHLPTPFYGAPQICREKKFPNRLLFWGSVGAELGATVNIDSLKDVIHNFNVWGLTEGQINHMVLCVLETTDFYSFVDIARAMQMDMAELFRGEWVEALCAIDSSIKRYRRSFLLNAIQDLPVDLYGKNLESFVRPNSKTRIMQVEPDDNRAFSHLCQEYAGLVNIDPNWSDGTNERASTALALGVNVASNRNKMLSGLQGFFEYDLNIKSIQENCLKALEIKSLPKYHTKFSWETGITVLMQEIYSQYQINKC